MSTVTRPVEELKGFEKLALAPGERKTVRFKLRPDDLAYLDEHLKRVVEAGAYEVMVGASAHDIRVRGRFEVK